MLVYLKIAMDTDYINEYTSNPSVRGTECWIYKYPNFQPNYTLKDFNRWKNGSGFADKRCKKSKLDLN